MKRILTALSVLLLLTGMTAFASSTKVGLINLPQILQHSPQVTAINKKLQNQFKPQQQKIVAAQNNIRAEVQKLNPSAKPQLSATQKKAVQAKISADQKQLQQMVVAFQQKVGSAQSKAMKAFMSEVNATVKSIAKAQKLSLVLLKPAVIYADNSTDLTQQVLSQLPKN